MIDLDVLLSKYRIPHVNNDFVANNMRVNRLFGLKDLIEENLSKDSCMCEVGSYMGVSSNLFANYCKTVYCVDVFCETHYEAIFDYNASFYRNIIKIKDTSVNASELFDDFSLDFVYIDAGHTKSDISEDILHWRNKIKTGGIIGGHDYHNTDSYVVETVDTILGKPDKVYEDSSWIKRL